LINLMLLAPLAQSGCTRVAELFHGQHDKAESAASPASAQNPPPAANGGSGMTCSECEHTSHKSNKTSCPDSIRRCETLPGKTAADSPMPNMSKSELCVQILNCFHRTHCAKSFNATDCLCGKGVNPDSCFAGTFEDTTGACRDLVAAGGESKSMQLLAERFSDAMFPIGVADTVLESCDFLACDGACL
jgi:hypothetical protein